MIDPHVGASPSGALTILSRLIGCCDGAANRGPSACTCWKPVYDLDQGVTVQKRRWSGPPAVRAKMCDDCAYRPDSPEANGDDRYAERPEPGEGTFFCHVGTRKVVRWVHPAGITVDADGDYYDPPSVTYVPGRRAPLKGDGSFADICAGWHAHQRALGQIITDIAYGW